AYSEKGREMKVYGPTDQPLVVFAGDDEKETGLRAALSRLLGGIGAVAGASLLVQYLAPEAATGSNAAGGGGTTDGSGGGDGGFTTADTDESGGTEQGGSGEQGGSADQGDSASGDSADGGTSTDGSSAEGGSTSGADGGSASGADDGGSGGDLPFLDGDVPLIDDIPILGDLLGAGLPPGALFFAGGATVMIAWFVLWYARAYRV
ncbi:MAG TPA: hypothetical protein VKM69_04315, partial [Natronoarchaeum rubrum]|nr:hypothetical protein [Natronoarchaeum rubrum]